MNIMQDVSLASYSGMSVGGQAAFAVEVHSRMELLEALSWAQEKQLRVITVGSGTNVLWRDEGFPGLLVINRIERYEQFDEDETNTYITVGSGERWDYVVQRTVDAGLTGVEALSMIPGTAGATPVQNVGAYGQEISEVLVSLEAFDTQAHDYVIIAGTDCGFTYRHSRFNTTDKGRFYITALTLHLRKGNPLPPFYSSVQAYFDEHHITQITPKEVRQAVTEIRGIKLPDPSVVPNNGSFFKNPIVSEQQFSFWSANYDSVPHWQEGVGKVKISAAWLIEQSGFKNIHDSVTGMATWPKQPLVLVNEHATSLADVMAFKQKITEAVHLKFNIALEQEPELLP
jgi:UDP-N-acetylmuramate dehydrogenase